MTKIRSEQLEDGLKLRPTKMDGADPLASSSTNLTAIQLAVSNSSNILHISGIYMVAAGTINTSTQSFRRGAILKPDVNATLTIHGQIDAEPDQQIFDLSNSGAIVNLPDVSNIKIGWFGAIPSNLESDATRNVLAFRGAIKALALGATLEIPPLNSSVYYLNAGAINLVSKNNICISGHGATLKFSSGMSDISFGSNGPYGFDSSIRVENCSGLTIKGITLHGNISARTPHPSTESFNSGIQLLGSSDVLIDNCFITEQMTDGVFIGGDGPASIGGCARITIKNSRITKCRRNNISPVQYDTLTVSNVLLEDAGTISGVAPMAGIDVEPETIGGSKNLTLDNVQITGSAGVYGLTIGGKGTERFEIRGCRVFNNLHYGMNFDSYSISTTTTAIMTSATTAPVISTTDFSVGDRVRFGPSALESVVTAIPDSTNLTIAPAISVASGAVCTSYMPKAYANIKGAIVGGSVDHNPDGGIHIVGFGLQSIDNAVISDNGNTITGLGVGIAIFDIDGFKIANCRIKRNAAGGIAGSDTIDSNHLIDVVECEIADNVCAAAIINGAGYAAYIRPFDSTAIINFHRNNVYSSPSATSLQRAVNILAVHAGSGNGNLFRNMADNNVPTVNLYGIGNYSANQTTLRSAALYSRDIHALVPGVGNLLLNGKIVVSTGSTAPSGLAPDGNQFQTGDIAIRNTYSSGDPFAWKCLSGGIPATFEEFGGKDSYLNGIKITSLTSSGISFGSSIATATIAANTNSQTLLLQSVGTSGGIFLDTATSIFFRDVSDFEGIRLTPSSSGTNILAVKSTAVGFQVTANATNQNINLQAVGTNGSLFFDATAMIFRDTTAAECFRFTPSASATNTIALKSTAVSLKFTANAASQNINLQAVGASGSIFLDSGSVVLRDTGAAEGARWTLASAGTTILQFASTVTSTIIKQADLTTNGGTGTTFLIQAQNETGTTSNGGILDLRSGTGTTAAGALTLRSGAIVRFTANNTGIGFYTATAVAQPVRVGQLSNQDVGASPTQTSINTAINAVLSKINSIESVISQAAGGVGLTA